MVAEAAGAVSVAVEVRVRGDDVAELAEDVVERGRRVDVDVDVGRAGAPPPAARRVAGELEEVEGRSLGGGRARRGSGARSDGGEGSIPYLLVGS